MLMTLNRNDGPRADDVSAGTKAIRHLNDAFRRNPGPRGVMATALVTALDADQLLALLITVRDFDSFDAGNDPHNEHDFGAVDFLGTTYFWKIDYYDLDRRYGSPDPANPDVTSRVLTIMRADEY